MTIIEFENIRTRKLVSDFVESIRPAPDKREMLDIFFRIKDQSFEIGQIISKWDCPCIKLEEIIAKGTYIRSRKKWELFWMRADLKWHRYDPLEETPYLEKVLEEIKKDPYGCFWS